MWGMLWRLENELGCCPLCLNKHNKVWKDDDEADDWFPKDERYYMKNWKHRNETKEVEK